LLDLADKQGETKGSRIYIDLPITNQELANVVGTSRETVSRLLNQLKKEQIIDKQRSQIIILDKDALRGWK
jgi:CRP/FNR family transcriptional regulator, cyclic AMP receptor protein